MITHSVKFAVVREDSHTDLAILEHYRCTTPLLVASGGCTLLDLKTARPELEVTGYDSNPAQLQRVGQKQQAVAHRDLRALNVDDPNPDALNQHGAFECLFRTWRCAFNSLIATPSQTRAFFEAPMPARQHTLAQWRASPYWPLSFDLLMHHPILDVMFGPQATQHAAPGSYSAYFERVFSSGLARPDAPTNPFLHHILLGHYLPHCAPAYVHAGKHLELELVEGGIAQVPGLERHDLVHLSNIFDWSDDAMIAAWCAQLERLRSGAIIVSRPARRAL